MSRRHSNDILGFVFGVIFGTITWTCDKLIPVVVMEPHAKAAEMCWTTYPLDGGLGECKLVDVWGDK